MTNLSPAGQGAPARTATSAAPQPGAPATPPAQTVATTTAAAQPDQTPRPVTGRNTPRLLAGLRVAVIVTSLAFAVLCLVGAALPYSRLDGARVDIEQGQRLRTAQTGLARAQAKAAEAADAKVNADPAAFRSELDNVSAVLVNAAAAYPGDAPALGKVAAQVSAYRSGVDQGLALKATNAAGAASAVDAANRSSVATASELQKLAAATDARLPLRFGTAFVPLVVAAGVVALAAAVFAATMLALRTRRFINIGLTAAVLALAAALWLSISAASAVTGAGGVEQGFALTSARAAVEAPALMEQARTAQVGGSYDGQTFAQLAPKVTQKLNAVGLRAATDAWNQAVAAQAKGDLAATRTNIDVAEAALAPIANSNAQEAIEAVSYTTVLAYGMGAALLALLAAMLASWGLSTRLSEYR